MKKIILFFTFFLFATSFFVVQANLIYAAECGDVDLDGVTDTTPCLPGDTVLGANGYVYTLTDDINGAGSYGLIFGSEGITIDGAGFSVVGTGERRSVGIYNGGYGNTTIKNVSVNNFNTDISYVAVSGGLIDSVIIDNSSGIYIQNSNHLTITNNTVTSSGEGIGLEASTDCLLTDNVVESGYQGINLAFGSDNNTLIRNTTNNNAGNGIVVSGSNNTLTENISNFNGNNGISVTGSSFNVINDNTTNSNKVYGFQLSDSTENTLTNNVSSFNAGESGDSYGVGFYLLNSENNNLSENVANSNSNFGFFLSNSNNNIISENIVNSNAVDVRLDSSNTNEWSNNNFFHNFKTQKMFIVDESVFGDRRKNIGDIISFDISMFNIDGTDCTDCQFVITSEPSETIDSVQVGNNITGSFSPTKNGTYSIVFKTEDSYGNISKKKYSFFVGSTASSIIRYFMRGIAPTHGQPANPALHGDAKSMTFTEPTEEEWWECGQWIQNSPDEIPPEYSLSSLLTSANIHSWYRTMSIPDGEIGIQRWAVYDTTIEASSVVSAANDYTEKDINFSDINWAMDYPQNWYWPAFKLKLADGVPSFPRWFSSPSQLSYVDFVYEHATSPAIKSISDEDAILLSATEDTSGTSTVVLENPTPEDITTDVVLSDFIRPFSGVTTSIASNFTSTILDLPIEAGSSAVATTANASILPAAGSVEVDILSWLTSDTYIKEWDETGTGSLSVAHTIGDFKPGSRYDVKIDGTKFGTYLADSNGEISFTYDGHYSTHTFTVAPSPVVSGGTSSVRQEEGASLLPVSAEIVCEMGDIFNVSTGLPCTSFLQTAPSLETAPVCVVVHTLMQKNIGDEVKCVQKKINEKINSNLVVDGIFGPLTKSAVVKFQLANGLVGDGIVGPLTRAVLNK